MQGQIDPEILKARKLQAAAAPAVDLTKIPVAEARALANRAAMVFGDGQPKMERIEDFEVTGDGGPIRARLYQPADARTDASLLYIHGGGWFACDVDTHDRMLRFLARESSLSVIAFDYRLSPEHPYPAALDDCRAVWAWLHATGAAHGIETEQVVVAGDSAGANLGLALAIDQRDRGRPTPAGLALLYGCFAPEQMTESRATYGTGAYGLTGERMDWYWSNYLGSAADNPPMLATPLHAALARLPSVYLGIAEYDVVSDESRLLAARLAEAGVPVELDVWPNATHGMLQMTRDVKVARDAVRSIARAVCEFLRALSAAEPKPRRGRKPKAEAASDTG
jgi:acetyl esterase